MNVVRKILRSIANNRLIVADEETLSAKHRRDHKGCLHRFSHGFLRNIAASRVMNTTRMKYMRVPTGFQEASPVFLVPKSRSTADQYAAL